MLTKVSDNDVPLIANVYETEIYVKEILENTYGWQLSKEKTKIEIKTFCRTVTILSKENEPYESLYLILRNMRNISVKEND